MDDEAWSEVWQIPVDRAVEKAAGTSEAGRCTRDRGGGGQDLFTADSAGALLDA